MNNVAPVNLNMFTYTQLSAQEEVAGAMLTSVQISSLRNLICQTMQELAVFYAAPSDPDVFTKIARAQGEIQILNYLIERSNSLTQQPTQEN